MAHVHLHSDGENSISTCFGEWEGRMMSRLTCKSDRLGVTW